MNTTRNHQLVDLMIIPGAQFASKKLQSFMFPLLLKPRPYLSGPDACAISSGQLNTYKVLTLPPYQPDILSEHSSLHHRYRHRSQPAL